VDLVDCCETLVDMRLADPLEDLLAPLGTVARPLWRGRLHQLALFVFVPMFLALILVAHGTEAKVVAAVYGFGVCSMLTASATYHRWVHGARARASWQRADHAMIYAAIAGSFTPVCVLAVPHWWGLPTLAVMWCAATLGGVMKFTNWRHRRIVGGVLYISLGWATVAVFPAVWHSQGVFPVVLLGIGGFFYTVGAILLYRRQPRLAPAVFSYHEVWHACTVVAAMSHFAGVWVIVARA
jgi:hemolysin III